MVRAVDKADAMLTLSSLYDIGSHLPFLPFYVSRQVTLPCCTILSERSLYSGICLLMFAFVLTLWSDNSALSTVKLRITQFLCLRSCSLELSTSSHSRPVFIAVLFLQPCQDWSSHRGLWHYLTFVIA